MGRTPRARPVTIRAGRRHDIVEILKLWAVDDVEPTTTDDSLSLAQLLDHDSEALLVAGRDDQLVGTLIAAWDGWRAGMFRLAVDPDHRRQGVARALVESAEQRFRALGATRVATFVVTTDSTPSDFWTAVGYQAQTHRRRLVKNLAPDSAQGGVAAPARSETPLSP